MRRPEPSDFYGGPSDPRYGLKRWKRLRAAVLDRDMHQCRVVPGCPHRAQVADHVRPVYPGMPDAEFFDPRNLRAACKAHNLRRGHVARFVRETDGQDVVTRDYTRPEPVNAIGGPPTRPPRGLR